MKTICRKPRPSMPHWWWLGQDGCWFCHDKNNCNSCKAARTSGKNDPKLNHLRDKQQSLRYYDWSNEQDSDEPDDTEYGQY